MESYRCAIKYKCSKCGNAIQILEQFVNSEFELGVETKCNGCGCAAVITVTLEALAQMSRSVKDLQTNDILSGKIKKQA